MGTHSEERAEPAQLRRLHLGIPRAQRCLSIECQQLVVGTSSRPRSYTRCRRLQQQGVSVL
eukprot:10822316-Prorocentrum_lima.AAC.1